MKKKSLRLDYPAEYRAWAAVKQRCTNIYHNQFKKYGGVGVKMDDSWMEDFNAFFYDVGKRPSEFHSLSRIKPDGDYVPFNVTWAIKNASSLNKLYASEGNDRVTTYLPRELLDSAKMMAVLTRTNLSHLIRVALAEKIKSLKETYQNTDSNNQ